MKTATETWTTCQRCGQMYARFHQCRATTWMNPPASEDARLVAAALDRVAAALEKLAERGV